MTTAASPRRPAEATCRVVEGPVFGVAIRGTIDRTNAQRVCVDLIEAFGAHRGASVLDLTDVVLADCAGVRLVREAIASLVGSGHRVVTRTADPVARVSFDVARVA
jgi:anti-anti-sigma regulatory factor